MNFQFFFFAFFLFIFSCSNPSTNSSDDIWQLESQEVMMMDTTFSKDALGNSTFKIDTVSFPIRNNVQETWTFTLDDSLLISTILVDGKIHHLKYGIENTADGFFLKRNEENQFCKILKKDEEEMILEARGKIILKKAK